MNKCILYKFIRSARPATQISPHTPRPSQSQTDEAFARNTKIFFTHHWIENYKSLFNYSQLGNPMYIVKYINLELKISVPFTYYFLEFLIYFDFESNSSWTVAECGWRRRRWHMAFHSAEQPVAIASALQRQSVLVLCQSLDQFSSISVREVTFGAIN